MKIIIELDSNNDAADLAAIFDALAGRDEFKMHFDADKGAEPLEPSAPPAAFVPPPPPSDAPPVAPAAPPAKPTGPLDTTGLPWDERIHAGTKGTNKDGSYKRRKGCTDATFDTVSAELRAGIAASVPNVPASTESPAAVATDVADTPPPPPSDTRRPRPLPPRRPVRPRRPRPPEE